LCLCLFAGALCGQWPTHSFAGDPRTRQETTEAPALVAAVCEGKADGGACDKCSADDAIGGGGWHAGSIRIGHFLEATSEDAIMSFDGCTLPARHSGGTFVLTRRSGQWQLLDKILGFDVDLCHRMRSPGGRELLVCENDGGGTDYAERTLFALFGGKGTIDLQNLLTVQDERRQCLYPPDEPNPFRAERLDRVVFGDLNGDGRQDISITASQGFIRMNPKQMASCEAAVYERPGGRMPEPAWKSYRIEYLFDGKHFALTPESQAPAKRFEHPE
jgi:hypothetical protein